MGWLSSFIILVYDASNLSTVCLVKWPFLGLQRAPENSEFTQNVLSDWGHAKLCFFWDKLELHQCIAQWKNFLTLNKQINMPFKMSKKHIVCSSVAFHGNFLFINSVFLSSLIVSFAFLHSKLCSLYQISYLIIIVIVKGT